DHDHGIASYRWGRPASGQASLEAAAKLLSGHARRSREGGGDTTLASRHQPTVRNGVSRRRPESLAHTGRHRQQTMTVSSRLSPDGHLEGGGANPPPPSYLLTRVLGEPSRCAVSRPC